jgi:hypothetical protein
MAETQTLKTYLRSKEIEYSIKCNNDSYKLDFVSKFPI